MRRKLRIGERKQNDSDSDEEGEPENESASFPTVNHGRDTVQGNVVRARICDEYFR